MDYGLNADLVPTVTDVIIKEPDGKESTRVYYQCKTCPHKAQNRASMMNHARKCLNIWLQCFACGYLADSSKTINSHVQKEHRTSLAMELAPITKQEAAEVLEAIVSGQQS